MSFGNQEYKLGAKFRYSFSMTKINQIKLRKDWLTPSNQHKKLIEKKFTNISRKCFPPWFGQLSRSSFRLCLILELNTVVEYNFYDGSGGIGGRRIRLSLRKLKIGGDRGLDRGGSGVAELESGFWKKRQYFGHESGKIWYWSIHFGDGTMLKMPQLCPKRPRTSILIPKKLHINMWSQKVTAFTIFSVFNVHVSLST